MSSGKTPGKLDVTPKEHELTIRAVLLALVLSVVMGAANVYLGLKAGMTVSASIPAAVIAMGILRSMFRDSSILESNLVQTAASAGESLAAGIIFTMPALILVGIWEDFDFWTTSLIALAGGLLGILFMIPMRRVFVVDNTELKYPEGLACAEVLRAGSGDDEGDSDEERSETGFLVVMVGLLVGANFKFATSFLSVLQGASEWATRSASRVFFLGADLSPALLAVGFIVGLPIAVQIFIGGAIGWLITIPLLGTEGLEAKEPVGMAYELWSTQVRYMGVGAMIVGGVASIWSVRGGLLSAFGELGSLIKGNGNGADDDPTERNLSGTVIVGLAVLCIGLTAWIYWTLLHNVGLTTLATIVMVVMAFFFSAVASYIVGLVGNSNSPVSGMTITAVLGTGAMITLFGFSGNEGILATLGVAGVVCCVACTSGDVCNDLKTGHLVGASPRSQQVMQILGVLVAAFVLAPVMTVLHQGSLNNGTGGIGGEELPAPQAGLFAALAQGFFGDTPLPYDMVLYGVVIGVAILVLDLVLAASKSEFRLHVMPVAVGIYLPFGLAPPILLGGLVHFAIRFLSRGDKSRGAGRIRRGVLLTSGIIAGESLVGVLLGFLAWRELTARNLDYEARGLVSMMAFLAVAAFVFVVSRRGTEEDL